jgi:hypothetical protein
MIGNAAQLQAWLCAISIAIGANAFATDRDPGDLKPGDPSYPTVNSTPTHVIPLVVSGPEWLRIALRADYISDDKPALCGYEILVAGHFAYGISLPINLASEGNVYRGNVVVDNFNPGACHWRFVGVSYGGWAPGIWNPLAIFAESGGLPAVAEPQMEFWCYKVTYEEKTVVNCEELVSLRWSNAIRVVSQDFLSKFTADQKGHQHIIRVTSQTKRIRVILHDLNAIQGALIPAGDREAQIARAKADQGAAAETPEYKALMCVQPALGQYVRSDQPLPDGPTQGAAVKAIKQKCRAEFGLPPSDFEE